MMLPSGDAHPHHILFSKIKWLDSWRPLIGRRGSAAGHSTSFVSAVLYDPPRDLDDAASIDGAGPFSHCGRS